jgi:hypothetical protein
MMEPFAAPQSWTIDVMRQEQPCCWCGKDRICRNVVLIQRLAPVPGTGWGCLICGLPNDGAIAVGCDECMAGADLDTPVWVCSSWAGQVDGAAAERVRYEDLPPDGFGHKPGFHEEERAN